MNANFQSWRDEVAFYRAQSRILEDAARIARNSGTKEGMKRMWLYYSLSDDYQRLAYRIERAREALDPILP